MKFIKVTIHFESEDIYLAEELISEIFFSFDLKGVVCNVPLEEADQGFGTDTLAQPEDLSVTGYLPCIDASEHIFKRIKDKALGLEYLAIKTNVLSEIVDEKDWAEAWKAYFNVTHISDRITIKPQWKDHVAGKNEIVIHLDPGMAFGTGTHPTTAMCLRLIETSIKPGAAFLDIGTGSGILMIAAAKLGAGSLSGIDTDETAIGVAKENLKLNSVDPDQARLACAGIGQTEAICYDLIVANIITRVIIDILPEIEKRMSKNSKAILSGIIHEQVPKLMEAIQALNLTVIHKESMEEWVSLIVNKS